MIAALFDAVQAMLSHDFIARAFLAGSGIALAAGLIGYFVVLRSQVFAGDALGHAAFTGTTAALVLGVDLRLGLFGATIVFAVAVGSSAGSRWGSRDVAIGVGFAGVLGFGVLFLSIYTTAGSSANGAAGVSVLFGSIFGLSTSQALTAVAISAVVVALLLGLGRPLLFASVDPQVAAARGVPVRVLAITFMVLLGLAVGDAVQAVGSLLSFGLLVTPAATAHRLTARPHRALFLAATISLADMWVGLTLSYVFPQLPPSFLILALGFTGYLAALIAAAMRRGRHRASALSVAGAAS
ncbi:MAG: metal ABC transporter permease [Candidatus Dormibacteria bacterium]